MRIKALERDVFNNDFVFFFKHNKENEIFRKYNIKLTGNKIEGYYYEIDKEKFDLENFKKDFEEKFGDKYNREVHELAQRFFKQKIIENFLAKRSFKAQEQYIKQNQPKHKLITTWEDLIKYIKEQGDNSTEHITIEADAYNCRLAANSISIRLTLVFFDENKYNKLEALTDIKYVPDKNIENLNNVRIKATGYIKLYQTEYQFHIKRIKILNKKSYRLQNIERVSNEFKKHKTSYTQQEEIIKRIKTGSISKIGLITSVKSKAYDDFKKHFNDDFESKVTTKEVRLKNINTIINAIKELNEEKDCQLIVIVRGGGDPYDLYEFSKKSLVEAVANSEIPIITGLGHITDISVCDEVAFYNAGTPSNAGEYVRKLIYDEEKQNKVVEKLDDIIKNFQNQIDDIKEVKNIIKE